MKSLSQRGEDWVFWELGGVELGRLELRRRYREYLQSKSRELSPDIVAMAVTQGLKRLERMGYAERIRRSSKETRWRLTPSGQLLQESLILKRLEGTPTRG